MAEKSKGETSIGKKIKKIRTEKKISLEQLAKETDNSQSFIKDIEAGRKIPPVGTILALSKALQIDSNYLFQEESKLKKRIDAYTKRTENYAYTTLTPKAEKLHLKAFKVTIEPKEHHAGVGYAHDGEEFVYVFSGKIEITIGDKKNILMAEESIQFDSGQKHLLKNVSNQKAELLVVIYAP